MKSFFKEVGDSIQWLPLGVIAAVSGIAGLVGHEPIHKTISLALFYPITVSVYAVFITLIKRIERRHKEKEQNRINDTIKKWMAVILFTGKTYPHLGAEDEVNCALFLEMVESMISKVAPESRVAHIMIPFIRKHYYQYNFMKMDTRTIKRAIKKVAAIGPDVTGCTGAEEEKERILMEEFKAFKNNTGEIK